MQCFSTSKTNIYLQKCPLLETIILDLRSSTVTFFKLIVNIWLNLIHSVLFGSSSIKILIRKKQIIIKWTFCHSLSFFLFWKIQKIDSHHCFWKIFTLLTFWLIKNFCAKPVVSIRLSSLEIWRRGKAQILNNF